MVVWSVVCCCCTRMMSLSFNFNNS
uniref:Uncharacterized protein n=1 Tax=Anguilla anguilla TaxID=7936 RepID=A0A0E9PJR3_ANGAN